MSKQFILSHPVNGALNPLVDWIFEEMPELPGELDSFKIIEGAAGIFTSGDTAVIRVEFVVPAGKLEWFLGQLDRLLARSVVYLEEQGLSAPSVLEIELPDGSGAGTL
jgi:hypothetical protein